MALRLLALGHGEESRETFQDRSYTERFRVYPRTYFETFMRYEEKNQVFVAMPFSATFRSAFERVIQPAIQSVAVRGQPLAARIINWATFGSPDIHEEIFDAILHSRLVIADMTVETHCANENGSLKWQPNANVAYEVGLAAAWRNPEDILLIHQSHPQHRYSFDVQNLRHVEYDPNTLASIPMLADEIVRALNQSTFLATLAYQRILQTLSPSAIHFVQQEARWAFPVIAFQGEGMPIMDARIHAATELLSAGALKNRHVIRDTSGTTIIYEWSELGLRMLLSLHAAIPERVRELRQQIESVRPGSIPPPELLMFPKIPSPGDEHSVDMEAATRVDSTSSAAEKKT